MASLMDICCMVGRDSDAAAVDPTTRQGFRETDPPVARTPCEDPLKGRE